MPDPFARTRYLLGQEAMERLRRARVAVFGLGGVGGYACEALARSGVGTFGLVDNDRVSLTNLNRQILATHASLGQYKTDAARARILDINPEAEVRTYRIFFLPENADGFPFREYDYILDAVDTVSAKIELIVRAQSCGVPVISAMGAGNKLDGSRFRVADLYETRVCPLARIMRKELRRRGVPSLKVVYSDEPPLRPRREGELIHPTESGSPALRNAAVSDNGIASENGKDSPALREGPETAPAVLDPEHPGRRDIPGSTAFVPSVAGLLMAGEVVRDLCGTGSGR